MISFSSVTKKFGTRTTALNNVSFRVKPGEFVFVTGPSGSGKTTIMKLLIKEYAPTYGEIDFDGVPLEKIKGRKLPYHRRRIGVIFQDYKLLPELNIWENIALPLYISRKSQSEIESRVTDLLRLVSIEEKAWLFPSQLSGGESQRVSIARALATGPKVIFADEPTGNLDSKTGLKITKLLKKINDLGTTLIFATHDQTVLDAFPNERRIHLTKEGVADNKKEDPKPAPVAKPAPAAKPAPVTEPTPAAKPAPVTEPTPAAKPAPAAEPAPVAVTKTEKEITPTPEKEPKKIKATEATKEKNQPKKHKRGLGALFGFGKKKKKKKKKEEKTEEKDSKPEVKIQVEEL